MRHFNFVLFFVHCRITQSTNCPPLYSSFFRWGYSLFYTSAWDFASGIRAESNEIYPDQRRLVAQQPVVLRPRLFRRRGSQILRRSLVTAKRGSPLHLRLKKEVTGVPRNPKLRNGELPRVSSTLTRPNAALSAC